MIKRLLFFAFLTQCAPSMAAQGQITWGMDTSGTTRNFTINQAGNFYNIGQVNTSNGYVVPYYNGALLGPATNSNQGVVSVGNNLTIVSGALSLTGANIIAALGYTPGTGNVSSVGQTFTGGLISVTGSPVTGSGTLTLSVAGTSGGIPYFSSTSTWASSGALTANAPVIGGGPGTAPSVGARSGNTTTFATANGTLTNGHCVQIDSAGNFVDAGGVCTTGGGGGTVSAGTAGQLTYYQASGTTVVGATTGTGVLTALGTNVGSVGSPVVNGGSLGTPASGNLANATGLPTTGLTGTLQAAQEPAHTGDMTNSAGSLATSVNSIGGKAVTLGGTLTTSGAFSTTLTTTGTTSLTLPTSGTVTALGNATTGSGSIVLATSPTASNLTVTGSLTATGLVTNADLANPATTVNGTTCTLGSTCSVTAAATSVTVGSTSVVAGTSNGLLYNNAGTLGNLATANSGVLVTSGTGVPSISTTLPNVALGTPTSIALTNATGLPITTGVSGLGTGVATALSSAFNTSGGVLGVNQAATVYAALASSPVFTGGVVTSSSSSNPRVTLTATGNPTDAKIWDTYTDTIGSYYVRAVNDAFSAQNVLLSATRTGNTITGISFPSSVVNFSNSPVAPTPATTDNSTNVATTAYVTAKFATQCTNVLNVGFVGNGSTDNLSAWNSLMSAMSSSGCVYFPAGDYYFSAPASVTIPSYKNLKIVGDGTSTTKLDFASGSSGLLVSQTNNTAIVTANNFSITARGTSLSTIGFKISLTSNTGSVGGSALSSNITNIEIRGNDGAGSAYFFGTGFQAFGSRYINLINVHVFGGGTCSLFGTSGSYGCWVNNNATGFNFGGTSTFVAVQFNLVNCAADFFTYPIYVADYTEGVILTNFATLSSIYAIFQPSGNTHILDQMTVVGGNFNTIYGINLQSKNINSQFIGNTFLIAPTNSYATNPFGAVIYCVLCTVTGNSFQSISGAPSSNAGIVFLSSSQSNVITGNTFWTLSNAVAYQASANNNIQATNVFSGNTTNTSNAGTGNSIGVAVP